MYWEKYKQQREIDHHKRIGIIEVPMFGRTTEVTVGLEIIDRK